MGRVHKKKLAQYNKENGEGKDGAALDNSTNGDEKSSDRSRAESDADESIASSKRRTPKSTPVVDDKAQEDDEEQIDDIDRSDKKNDSVDDGNQDEDDAEVNKSTPIGKKTALKRKASARSKVDDGGDDADEGETNGPTPAKKSAAKKNAGKKIKAKPKSKKQKVETDEEDGEKDEDDEDPDETSGEGDQEYEVEQVVDHKVEKGVSYYLIRWKGYGPNDDTWEEERTLSCQDLIDKFNKKKPSTKSPKPKPASKKIAGNNKASSDKKESEDPEKQWEVDKIIDYSDEKKGRLFRIRWKGYSAKFDTWEPEEHLNCDELIQKFLKKVESQKNISFKELREEPKKTKRMVSEGFLKAEKGARKSKRGSGKQRIQYADSD